MTIQILVSSKKNIILEGICAVIEKSEDLQLSGIAEDVATALRLCEVVKPQVIVATNELPGLTDISSFIKELAQTCASSKVVVIANVPNHHTAFEIFAAGALAFISPTDDSLHELPLAIKSAAKGRVYLSEHAPNIMHEHIPAKHSEKRSIQSELGGREEQVLVLLASGHSSKKIAQLLLISTSTVEVHRRNIMRKTGLHNIADLTRFAIRNRLVSV